MLEAMRDTVALMDEKLPTKGPYHSDRLASVSPDLRPAHIRDMLEVMVSGVNPQNPAGGFSDGKMGRWLGWAQAAVVAMGCGTLEDMKSINRKWADS
jgi:hypothetical protein